MAYCIKLVYNYLVGISFLYYLYTIISFITI